MRTTLAAVTVVALALLVGAAALIWLVRGSLRDGLESAAEQRAELLAEEVQHNGLPRRPRADEDLDDPEELVWQISAADGRVVRSSQPLAQPLPRDDQDELALPEADHPYLVVTERAGDHVISVAISTEDVAEATEALVWPLAIGLPALLLVVGATTWMVATRALRPVARIRREVDQISGAQLDRRVPEPAARDEIHRLAQTMNRMLARLQQSRDAQRQFVSDASHELRSPLAAIRQTAEVASSHPGALPEGELAEAVLEESTRMQRLVEQLLLLTRADESALAIGQEDVDLDDLALSVSATVSRPDVRVDRSGVGAVRVRGDGAALARVLQNLVDNGVRHARTVVALRVWSEAAGAVLVVEDDGDGIDARDRQRVFERFVRLDESRARDAAGSGLGLAIAREIVTAHAGTITVDESRLGGACVVVRLPGLVRT